MIVGSKYMIMSAPIVDLDGKIMSYDKFIENEIDKL